MLNFEVALKKTDRLTKKEKKMKRLSLWMIAIALMAWVVPTPAASQVVKLGTAWQPEHETFMPRYTNQKGWDNE